MRRAGSVAGVTRSPALSRFGLSTPPAPSVLAEGGLGAERWVSLERIFSLSTPPAPAVLTPTSLAGKGLGAQRCVSLLIATLE